MVLGANCTISGASFNAYAKSDLRKVTEGCPNLIHRRVEGDKSRFRLPKLHWSHQEARHEVSVASDMRFSQVSSN